MAINLHNGVDSFGVLDFAYEKVCIYWGWYLAADFQMFIIALLILYTFNKSKKIGKFF